MSTAPPTCAPDATSLRFVQAKAGDFLAIEEIYRQAFLPYLHFVGAIYQATRAASWKSTDARNAGLLLPLQAWRQALAGKICVLPARQKTGVGLFPLGRIVGEVPAQHGLDEHQRVFMEQRISANGG